MLPTARWRRLKAPALRVRVWFPLGDVMEAFNAAHDEPDHSDQRASLRRRLDLPRADRHTADSVSSSGMAIGTR